MLFINNNEYYYLVIFIFITFLFTFFLIFVTKVFSESSLAYVFLKDKLSPYECGFIPYDDARAKFEVHFYIVSLLFVIFDVEVILLIPWAVNGLNSLFSLFVIFIFFFILGLGFLYELSRGALSWFFLIE